MAGGAKSKGFQSLGRLAKLGPLDADGQKLWTEITKKMPAGFVQSVDAGSLYGLCINWSLWLKWKKLAVEGLNKKDIAAAYKASCMQAAMWGAVEKGFAKFGLTPKDRMLMKLNNEEDDTDELEKAVSKRKKRK